MRTIPAIHQSFFFLLVLLHQLVSVTSLSEKQQAYAQARKVRIDQGHAAAYPLYREILQQHPEDVTTATRLAAASSTLKRHSKACNCSQDVAGIQRLRQLLEKSNYNTASIAKLMGIPDRLAEATCPIYITPSTAGAITRYPFTETPTALECLVTLFLLGLAIPRDTLLSCMSLNDLELMTDLGLLFPCEIDDNLLMAYVQIFPLQLNETLYLVTDWHPRVLSSTVAGSHDAVMYIGPDSLALVQHLLMDPNLPPLECMVDVCTGSGIQALVAIASGTANRGICVDINPRALQFCRFNATLNGLEQHVEFVLGDLLTDKGRMWTRNTKEEEDNVAKHNNQDDESLQDLLESLIPSSQHVLLTANPPFLPVPPSLSETRHGLFSAGGVSGEAHLLSILNLTARMSSVNVVAIVSEFFLNDDSAADSLLDRLQRAWKSGIEDDTIKVAAKGLLLTNEFPISVETYAERRADSPSEFELWRQHLNNLHIVAASPGFLYIQKMIDSQDLELAHVIVPKSKSGSIWTPSNPEAVAFTQDTCRRYFGWSNR